MSIGNLKDSGNLGNNFPWQLKMLNGTACICDGINESNINLDSIKQSLLDILNELADQTNLLVAIENNTDGLESSLTTIKNALTGTFTPGAILGSTLTFPYLIAANTYKAFTIIVPTGETIEFQGAALPAGTWNFSGEGSQKSTAVVLSNPTPGITTSNIVILTVE